MFFPRKYRQYKTPAIIGSMILAVLLIVGGYFAFRNGSSLFTQKEPVKVRLAWPLNSGVIAGKIGMILQNKDFLKKSGFDEVEVKSWPSANETRQALLTGDADVIITDETGWARVAGQNFGAYAVVSLNSDGKVALVALDNASLNGPVDLKGKSVGVLFGSLAHKQTLDWLKDVSEVKFVNLADMNAARNALTNGEVDAIVDADPELTQGVETGKYKKLAEADFNSVVLVSADFADKNPGSVEKIKQAFRDAIWYLNQNKDQAATWYGAFAKIDKNLILEVSKTLKITQLKKESDIKPDFSPDLIAKINDFISFLADRKMIQGKVDVRESIK